MDLFKGYILSMEDSTHKMRFFSLFIIGFICLPSFGNEVDGEDNIWIYGNSLSEVPRHNRTIYFDQWDDKIHHFLSNEDVSVAVQLNHQFDPLPADKVELPNITSLAAIASDSILSNYFGFLERIGRTKGVDYMVLPETARLNPLEQRVVLLASQSSPFYFLSKSSISHALPDSKKEFLEQVHENPKIWLISESDKTKKIDRWGKKLLGNEAKEFFNQVKKSKQQPFDPLLALPAGLTHSIFESATFAIDNLFQLPISAASICYLGRDFELKNWLSKYVEVFDHRLEGIPTIVDNRDRSNIPIRRHDIVLGNSYVENEEVTQVITPFDIDSESVTLSKMLFGVSSIHGIHAEGRVIPNQHNLGFSNFLTEGLTPSLRQSIDSLGEHAIQNFATPGLQLAVLRNGSMVYQSSKGHYTYDSIKAVDNNTMYDLASLTKVMASLPAIALLVDRNLISLDDSVSTYLSEFVGSNKSGITIKQLLSHHGGLKSYVPFWRMILEGDRLDAFYYKTEEDEANDIRSYGYQPDPIMLDTLKSYLVKSELIKNPGRYNYSDLGFMILHLIVEQVTQKPFDQFLYEEFYYPMGLSSTVFNPLENGFEATQIAPTEFDNRFRNYQVWGEVHDRNATIFGGVSGHAGLFSNALDLAKMMSMYLNNGVYGGRRYLSEEVLRSFNTTYFQENRRGLGWDKKEGDAGAGSKYASKNSFGHTGFTGTMVWADPDEDLIFVFLSNRIYPDANNNRLSKYQTRTQMHDVLYEAIIPKKSLKLN